MLFFVIFGIITFILIAHFVWLFGARRVASFLFVPFFCFYFACAVAVARQPNFTPRGVDAHGKTNKKSASTRVLSSTGQKPNLYKSRLQRAMLKMGIGGRSVYAVESGAPNVNFAVDARDRQMALLEILDSLGAFDLKVATCGFVGLTKLYGGQRGKPADFVAHFARVMGGSRFLKTSSVPKYDYLLSRLFHSRLFTDKDAMDFLLYSIFWANAKYRDFEDKAKVKGRFVKSFVRSASEIGLIGRNGAVGNADIAAGGLKNPEKNSLASYYQGNTLGLDKPPRDGKSVLFVLGGVRSDAVGRLRFLKSQCVTPNCRDLSNIYSEIILSHNCRRLSCPMDRLYTLQKDGAMEECADYLAKTSRRSGIKPDGTDLFIAGGKLGGVNNFGTKEESLMFNDNGELNEFVMLSSLFRDIIGGEVAYTKANNSCDSVELDSAEAVFTKQDVEYTVSRLNANGAKVVYILSSQPNAIAHETALLRAINELRASGYAGEGFARKKIEVKSLSAEIQYKDIHNYGFVKNVNAGLAGMLKEGFLLANDKNAEAFDVAKNVDKIAEIARHCAAS